MTPTERKLRRLLRDLVRHFRSVERCRVCVPQADALEGCHAREWARLRERIEAEARDTESEGAPN